MSVMKNCNYRGCRTSPRCQHEWFFDIEYKKTRYSMRVNEYAALHGATRPVTSNQEAREVTCGQEMRDRIIGALETGCRQGEMQKVQNGDIDRHSHEIKIAKAHTKASVARRIPF